jgi:hypothetical protein
VPPEEQFWQRYSPHHEFPLSSATSTVLHALIIGLFILIGVLLFTGDGEGKKPPTIDFKVVKGEPGRKPGGPGGGGGSPEGVGNKPGGKDKPGGTEVSGGAPKDRIGNVPDGGIKLEDVPIIPLKVTEGPGGVPTISGDVWIKLTDASAKAEAALKQYLSKGKGGPGSGGGKDSSTDTGTGKDKDKGPGGKDTGPGGGNTQEVREKRRIRWHLKFRTQNGDDYRDQLADLGAILVVPVGGDYLVIRNLKAGAAGGEIKDIRPVVGDRIFWTDGQKLSVESLSRALKLNPFPDRIHAFFPREFEDLLLKLELGYGGLPEDQIEETQFSIIRVDARYVPRVTLQRKKK